MSWFDPSFNLRKHYRRFTQFLDEHRERLVVGSVASLTHGDAHRLRCSRQFPQADPFRHAMRRSRRKQSHAQPRFHGRHEALQAVVFSGDPGPQLVLAQPAGDEVPILRVVALAEDEQAVLERSQQVSPATGGPTDVAIHHQLPRCPSERRPFQSSGSTLLLDAERDIQFFVFQSRQHFLGREVEQLHTGVRMRLREVLHSGGQQPAANEGA